MTAWLDPVRHVLDRRTSPVTIFFRDDDGGWNDARLYRLLDVTAPFGIPIDLAVIPAAISRDLGCHLRRCLTSDGLVTIHQHGFAHRNHEASGRTSEFGRSRSETEQRRDIELGRQRLEAALGRSTVPIFTPPWNRCTETTARCLVNLGFRILSRDASADRFDTPLDEVAVHLDWTGRRGIRSGLRSWADAIAARIGGSDLVGVMLHHAVMDSESRHRLADLLGVVKAHPMARTRSMIECAQPAVARSLP